MTLILAIDCADGMILASDSQGTLGPVRQDWEKVFTQHNNMAWGGAGNLGIVQRVREYINSNYSNAAYFNTMPPDQIKAKVSEAVAKVVRPMLVDRRLIATDNELTEYLFVGHSSRGSFVIKVDPNLTDCDYITTGYAAIGSIGVLPLVALSNLSHFDVRNRTLPEVKLIAHRVMGDAIRVASTGVALPIQMIEIVKPPGNMQGRARKLPVDEVDALGAAVEDWKELERTTLSDTLGIQVTSP